MKLNDTLTNDKVDHTRLYEDTLKIIRSKRPDHAILKLEPREQKEFMALLLRGQGWHIRESSKNKERAIRLPGLGVFLFNPLRGIARKIKQELTGKLERYEIDQLIKEKLADYYATHWDPFVNRRAEVYNLDFTPTKENAHKYEPPLNFEDYDDEIDD